MMKRLTSLILCGALSLCVLLAGCSNEPGESAQGDTNADTTAQAQGDSGTQTDGSAPYKVAYIVRTLSDPFAAWLANEITAQAAAYADTFTLDVLDAQGDSEKTNSLIETCITKKYDCVIIQPNDGELQRPYAQKIIDAGIYCITTNAKIPDLAGSSGVDADPYEQGAVLARHAAENVPENGKVVIMSCLPGNLHTTARLEAFKKEFVAKRPDVTILAEKILEQASEADAMATFEDWVQSYGKIDAALTVADAQALGCLEAVKGNSDYDDNFLCYGVDGLSSGLLLIKDGKYTATCFQNAIQLAELNLKAANELLSGEKETVEYAITADLVTIDNVDDFLQLYIDNGSLTQEEVDQHG